ncbi:MAG: formylglycine-generating enzyme family protein [Planctomycetota bacterium]
MMSSDNSPEKAAKLCRFELNRVLERAVLLFVCLVVFQPSDVLGEDPKLAGAYTEKITTKNDEELSFNMVLVPGGTFVMGSPENEPNHADDEGPQHNVRLDPFYLCTTETTIGLFTAYYQETVSAKKDFFEVQEAKKNATEAGGDNVDAITGPTPVYGDLTMGYGPRHPAIGMTWHNATNFCAWLSKKTGKKYRLPTEAEWEYACRAGAGNIFGATNVPEQVKDFAWYDATADSETSEVGKKKPNALGLYDTLGNVREWVSDFYSPTAYKDAAKKSPAVNPKGPKTGKIHVARGGDYSCPVGDLRCAARAYEEKWWRMGDPQIPKSIWWLPEMDIIGFRVARSVDPKGRNTPK